MIWILTLHHIKYTQRTVLANNHLRFFRRFINPAPEKPFIISADIPAAKPANWNFPANHEQWL